MAVLHGDCLDVMAGMDAESASAIVTDPPYGIAFMAKTWDHGVPGVLFWAEALRVAQPGAYLLAFGGTRTWHRLAVAIEDAGWDIRDTLCWMYGSGFPKNKRCLKPAWEPIIMARKAGPGDLQIEACRIEGSDCGGHWSGEDGSDATSTPGYDGGFTKGGRPKRVAHNESRPSGIFRDGTGGSHADGVTNVGRWPANVLLDYWYEPILRLKDSLDRGTVETIRRFFNDRQMRNLSQGVRRSTESNQAEQGPVLQPHVLREGPEREDGRAETLHVRAEAPASIEGEDDAQETGQRTAPARREQSKVQGLLDVEGVSVREHLRAATGRVDNGAEDGSEGASRHSGASTDHGDEVREAAAFERGSSPHQRCEERQSPRESGSHDQLDAQAGTQGDSGRTSRFEAGERAFTVAACDVPVPWLIYFEPTGDEVRCGSAQMLDAEVGTLTSGANPTRRGSDKLRGVYADFKGQTECTPARGIDSGGPSRFFYCAKASRSEREAGLDHLPERQRDLTRNEGDAGTNNPHNRGSQLRKNHHPTVKPISLMRWLVKLVTPPGGTVLDPFMGSGTTGCAAVLEQRVFIGVEKDAEYIPIAEARIAHWATQRQPEQGGLFG